MKHLTHWNYRWSWTLILLGWFSVVGLDAAVKTLTERGRWPGYRGGQAMEIQLSGSNAYVRGAQRASLYGQYAYVTGPFGAVQAFDVSNPAHPKLTAEWNSNAVTAQTAGWGPYIFEGHLSIGVQILDISTPSTPKPISHYNETLQLTMEDLTLVDKTLYLSCWDGLRVLDTSNPAKLRKVGTASGFFSRAVAAGERNLCASAGQDGLIVLDLYPEPPKLFVRVDASGYHLTLTAQAGRTVLIQRSFDLIQWTDWIVLEATGQAQTLTDPIGDNVSGQYYRASLISSN
jgi:hypothetical protein